MYPGAGILIVDGGGDGYTRHRSTEVVSSPAPRHVASLASAEGLSVNFGENCPTIAMSICIAWDFGELLLIHGFPLAGWDTPCRTMSCRSAWSWKQQRAKRICMKTNVVAVC